MLGGATLRGMGCSGARAHCGFQPGRKPCTFLVQMGQFRHVDNFWHILQVHVTVWDETMPFLFVFYYCLRMGVCGVRTTPLPVQSLHFFVAGPDRPPFAHKTFLWGPGQPLFGTFCSCMLQCEMTRPFSLCSTTAGGWVYVGLLMKIMQSLWEGVDPSSFCTSYYFLWGPEQPLVGTFCSCMLQCELRGFCSKGFFRC